MRIALLGAGAMGTIIGAYLTKAGYDVELVDNYKEHVDALNENGAHIVGFVDEIIPVKAVYDYFIDKANYNERSFEQGSPFYA